jgi:hypothetical protein
MPPSDRPAQPTDAEQVLARLRPLLAALGKSEADLDRWRQAGLALTTYRTPDGDRLIDPSALLDALAETPTAVRS